MGTSITFGNQVRNFGLDFIENAKKGAALSSLGLLASHILNKSISEKTPAPRSLSDAAVWTAMGALAYTLDKSIFEPLSNEMYKSFSTLGTNVSNYARSFFPGKKSAVDNEPSKYPTLFWGLGMLTLTGGFFTGFSLLNPDKKNPVIPLVASIVTSLAINWGVQDVFKYIKSQKLTQDDTLQNNINGVFLIAKEAGKGVSTLVDKLRFPLILAGAYHIGKDYALPIVKSPLAQKTFTLLNQGAALFVPPINWFTNTVGIPLAQTSLEALTSSYHLFFDRTNFLENCVSPSLNSIDLCKRAEALENVSKTTSAWAGAAGSNLSAAYSFTVDTLGMIYNLGFNRAATLLECQESNQATTLLCSRATKVEALVTGSSAIIGKTGELLQKGASGAYWAGEKVRDIALDPSVQTGTLTVLAVGVSLYAIHSIANYASGYLKAKDTELPPVSVLDNETVSENTDESLEKNLTPSAPPAEADVEIAPPVTEIPTVIAEPVETTAETAHIETPTSWSTYIESFVSSVSSFISSAIEFVSAWWINLWNKNTAE